MQPLLFPIDTPPIIAPTATQNRCKHCEHSERWQCGGAPIYVWYCRLRKSNRTINGQLKIKANQTACKGFKKAE